MAKVSYGQSGYVGCKMSERAKEAYDNGERPMSKWNKWDILNELEYDLDDDTIAKLSKYSTQTLKNVCLEWTSWHHTGSYANETDFYAVMDGKNADLNQVFSDLDEEEKVLKEFRKRQKEEKRLLESTEEKCYFRFGVWSGTKKHPKLVYYRTYGIKKGVWIYYMDGSSLKKKNASGNYVNVLQIYNRAPKGKAHIFNRIKKELKKKKGGK
jgi:hypothetical protein